MAKKDVALMVIVAFVVGAIGGRVIDAQCQEITEGGLNLIDYCERCHINGENFDWVTGTSLMTCRPTSLPLAGDCSVSLNETCTNVLDCRWIG